MGICLLKSLQHQLMWLVEIVGVETNLKFLFYPVLRPSTDMLL